MNHMIDLTQLQKKIWANKVEKGFNTTDVSYELNLLYGELAEVFDAYKKKGNVAEELADVAIFLLGLSEMLEVNLEKAVLKKVEKNKKREYKKIDGVMTRIKDGE